MTTSEHEDDTRWITAFSRARPQLRRDMRSRAGDDDLCAAAVASALAATAAVGTASATPLMKSAYAWLTAATGLLGATALTLWLATPPSPDVAAPPPAAPEAVEPTPTPVVIPPAPDAPVVSLGEATDPAPAQTPEATERSPGARRKAARTEAAAPATAASLFGAANASRRAGDYADAVASYRQLQDEWPDSREARISRLALGRLLLERMGKPRAALAQFETYLQRSPEGASAEDALVGRARALQKLGRHVMERTAWQRLLDSYPGSVHAPRARKRIEELGPP